MFGDAGLCLIHRAREGADGREYAQRLVSFLEALAESPQAGFVASWSCRGEAGPLGAAVEDWYLVKDRAALGVLNDAAVSAPRRVAHDGVAALVGEGAGAIYGLVSGDPSPSAGYRMRVSKPPGVSYAGFEAALVEAAGIGAAVWKRQMVLGPDAEFVANSTARPVAAVFDRAGEVTALHALGEGEAGDGAR